MWRAERINVIALVLSLLLHGTILLVSARVVVYQTSRIKGIPAAPTQMQPTQSRLMVDNPPTPPQEKEQKIEPITVEARPTPTAPPLALEPPPAPAPLGKPAAITPPELMPHDPPPPVAQPDGFGELSGSPEATALHSLSGDKPMEAKKADIDQPAMLRNPGGVPVPPSIPARTTPQEAQTPEEPKKVSNAAEAALAAMMPPAVAVQSIQPPEKPAAPLKATNNRFGPMQERATDAESRDKPKPTVVAMAQPVVPLAPNDQTAGAPTSESKAPPTPGDAATAGASIPSEATSAAATDSELDPFSMKGSAEFRAGRMTAHFGRRVEFRARPHFDLAAIDALKTLYSDMLVLRIRADETGKVRKVDVVESTGSYYVDHPCCEAVYEWWFEPPHDKAGKPEAAELIFRIKFVR